MKIGVCAWSLPGNELEAFAIAKEVALEGVVIDYSTNGQGKGVQTKEGQALYLAEAAKYEIAIPTMAFNIFCGRGFTKSENVEWAKEVLTKGIAIAASMGIAKIQIPSFFDNMIHTEEDLNNTIEVYKHACQQGAQHKVLIGSESVMTIAQHKKFYEEVNSPWLTTLFDTQNPWRMLNQDGVEIAKYMKAFTGELHAKDSIPEGPDTIQLGQGDVKFADIMKIYAKAGFDQWVHLEQTYNTVENYAKVIREDIKIVQNYFK